MNRSWYLERLGRVARRAARSLGGVAALGAVVAGCPGSGAAPAEPPRPATKSAPAATPRPAPAAAATFTYAPGSYRFVVTSEASIELSADSGSHSETRSTTAQLGYRIGGGTTGIRTITGVVDSFTVTPTAGAPVPVIAAPVSFRGTLDPARRLVTLQPSTAAPVSTDCGNPNQLLFAVVREAIVVPPSPLRVGQTWEDSATSTVCRGDVPLTTRALHRYTVAGAVLYEGAEALHLTRSSTIALSGEGAQRGVALAVAGQGSASADLFLDPTAGRFLGGLAESDVELTVTIPDRGPQRFRQRTRTRIETAPLTGRESGTRSRPAPRPPTRPRSR